MTRTEAAAVLGVGEDVPIGDLRRRYETLHNDYQIRLTNAPTAALKKTYQQKMQELMEAASTLQPAFADAMSQADLPSAEPSLDYDIKAPEPPRRPPERSGGTKESFGRAAPQDAGLPRSTMLAAGLAAVLAGALGFAVLEWTQAARRARALEAEGGKQLTSVKALQAAVAANERLMYDDRLRIQNLSKNSIRIVAAAFVYRDASGQLKLAHSGNAGYPSWEIKPGGTVQLDAQMGRGRLWDGPVTYYALLIEYPGVESFLKAGLWARDVDRDKAVTLDLD